MGAERKPPVNCFTRTSEPVKKHVTMRDLYRTATWTAALSAATGTGCLVAFFSGANPHAYVLTAAEAAATIGVLSILLSALVVYVLTQRRSEMNPALRGSLACHADGPRCSHKRRAVLDDRLAIDEPRLCSQYMIPCTCWSFCAGSGSERFAGEGKLPATRNLFRVRDVLSEAKELPVVHRNGMDGCPFRFASRLARSLSPDGVGPIPSDYGAATR